MDAPVAGPVGQRPAQRRSDHFLGCALGVVARLGTVHYATTGELRGPRRTLPGASGPLLPIRLAAAAADLAARLGRVRALAGRRPLCGDHLVHQRDIGWRIEQFGGQLDGALHLPVRRFDFVLQDLVSLLARHYFSPRLIALRTITSPPVRPGIAPLISSTPFSVSTLCTNRFCTVTRSLPIRPPIGVPLKPREGGARPPMEPGRRCTAWAP